MELLRKSNTNIPRTVKEREKMIKDATIHYGKFLNAMGFDCEADPQTVDTPRRVAKSWVNDLIIGSVSDEPSIEKNLLMFKKHIEDSGLINNLFELRGLNLGCFCKVFQCLLKYSLTVKTKCS